LLLALSCASCADLQVRKYRDDAFVRQYQYALGERYVDVDGLKLCYQDTGEGEAILILPGLGTSLDFWQLAVPALSKQHRVVAVDPPGFGKSDKPDVPYDLDWIAERVVAFMDRIQLRRATLMGGSLGGHLAVLIAIKHPDRVSRLVLMGSCGAWPRTGPLAELGLLVLWHDPIVIDHLRRYWPNIYWDIVGKHTPVSDRLFRYQMAQRAVRELYWDEGRAASRSLKSIFHTYTRPQIPEIQQPTLLIWGEHDRIHLLSEGLYFREHLPNSRLVVVPDSAHEVMLDRPEVFNRLVLAFLRDGLDAIPDDYACVHGGCPRSHDGDAALRSGS
jgi:abhydrolase domain-containing protein 6